MTINLSIKWSNNLQATTATCFQSGSYRFHLRFKLGSSSSSGVVGSVTSVGLLVGARNEVGGTFKFFNRWIYLLCQSLGLLLPGSRLGSLFHLFDQDLTLSLDCLAKVWVSSLSCSLSVWTFSLACSARAWARSFACSVAAWACLASDCNSRVAWM